MPDIPALPTVGETIDKLAALGDSRQIAQYLEAQNCAGDREVAQSCPVARHLSRETGSLVQVGDTICEYTAEGRFHVAFLPLPVRDFVNDFDGGHYPNLIKVVGDA